MKNATKPWKYCAFALLLAAGALAQDVPVILHVEYDNNVKRGRD